MCLRNGSPSSKCGVQNFTYDPRTITMNIHDPQSNRVGIEYMTTPPLLTQGADIPYQQSMIANYPMKLTRQQLEDRVALDGLGIGPGMVEGYRFRGNLNL
jgi:hypothetical protein